MSCSDNETGLYSMDGIENIRNQYRMQFMFDYPAILNIIFKNYVNNIP